MIGAELATIAGSIQSWFSLLFASLAGSIGLTLAGRLSQKGTANAGSRQLANRQLAETARRLAEQDCVALRQAVSDLAHGKVSARLTIASEPLDLAPFDDAPEVARALNTMILTLRETAAKFNTMTELPCRRLCYVGADSYLEGLLCGETLGKAVGGSGRVAVISSPGSMSLEMRVAGFQTRLREIFPAVEVVRVVYCTATADRICEAVEAETKALLDGIPHLAGIYLTRGGVPFAAARAVEAAGMAGRVKIMAHDMLDETMGFLERGVISATLGQDPYGQGHDPVIHLYNHLVMGWQPSSPRLLTPLDVVTRENCEQFWSAGHGLRVADKSRYALASSTPSPKPLRLAVLGRADNPFFEMVKVGVLAAAEEIRSLNATVDLIVPEENRRTGKISAEVYSPLVEAVRQQGYHGLAIGIFDPSLVPAVNRLSEAGIPIITYNSEPGGLRSMIDSNIDQSEKLLHLGRDLAETVAQINTATLQVNNSMNEVSQGAVSQTEQIIRTRESVESLVNHITEVTRHAGEGAAVAESAVHASHTGAEAIEKTLSSMKRIQASVNDTSENVELLGRNSDKIDGIIKTINTVAYQIKLLGINAAVEAAHAGDYGAGFSIVANEIRSLADRTAKATTDIVDVVKTVQSSIQNLQRAMVASLEIVQSGSELAGQAGHALGEIRKSVEQNKSRLDIVAASADKMQSFSQNVREMMGVVTGVSEKNSAAAEEVSAATQEMTAHLLDVRQMAQNLADMAEGEQKLLAKFAASDKG